MKALYGGQKKQSDDDFLQKMHESMVAIATRGANRENLRMELAKVVETLNKWRGKELGKLEDIKEKLSVRWGMVSRCCALE